MAQQKNRAVGYPAACSFLSNFIMMEWSILYCFGVGIKGFGFTVFPFPIPFKINALSNSVSSIDNFSISFSLSPCITRQGRDLSVIHIRFQKFITATIIFIKAIDTKSLWIALHELHDFLRNSIGFEKHYSVSTFVPFICYFDSYHVETSIRILLYKYIISISIVYVNVLFYCIL